MRCRSRRTRAHRTHHLPPRIRPQSAAQYPGVGECGKLHALSAPRAACAARGERAARSDVHGALANASRRTFWQTAPWAPCAQRALWGPCAHAQRALANHATGPIPHALHARLHTHVNPGAHASHRNPSASPAASVPHAHLHRMFSKQSQGLKKRRVVCALSLAAPPILTTLQLVVPRLGAEGL